MASETGESPNVRGVEVERVEDPITLQAVGAAIAGGLVGIVAMVPIVVGVPVALGLFTLEGPGGFARLIGAQPSPILGVVFFVIGGVVVLPLFFLATATFLPPKNHRDLRGIVISLIFWPGFVMGFWPGGGTTTAIAFLVISMLAHVVYGFALGTVLERLTGIPEHEL